ncbi:MAG: hypothetical protein WDA20_08045 [Desulfuromonadales bacterium]|jgi:hypothetical protein
MSAKTLLITASFLFLLTGCRAAALSDAGGTVTDGSERIEFVGRIVHVSLEGGFFGIIADNGGKYDPVALPEAFRRDDLRVNVEARRLPSSVGFHMWGEKIEIIAIKPL